MTTNETAAFRAALRAISPDLLGYFERRVSEREDAADLLAETMLQAWRRAKSQPHEAERQRMWLFTIAANVLANHRRSARRRSALADRLRHYLSESDVPDPTEPSRSVTRSLGSATLTVSSSC